MDWSLDAKYFNEPLFWLREYLYYNTSIDADPSAMQAYHYTDAHALMSIVKNCEVYATHARYFNDSSELRHGTEWFRKIIQAYACDTRSKPVFARFIVDVLDKESSFAAYVACFSQSGDSLSQWRGYGRGGAGYSIGIGGDPMLATAKAQGAFFSRVEYLPERKTLITQNFLRAVERHLLQDLESADNDTARDEAERLAIVALDAGMTRFACSFKDEVFESEQELRLVKIVSVSTPLDGDIHFRSSHGNITPYLKLKLGLGWPTSPFHTCYCGPTVDPESAAAGVTAFFASIGLDCKVKMSRVPLRF